MTKYINFKVYLIFMIKKLIISIMLITVFVVFCNSATTIHTCPSTATITNNTEYILASDFVFPSGLCFDLTGKSNITINGNNTYFRNTNLTLNTISNTNGLIVKNLNIDTGYFIFRLYNLNDNIIFTNNTIITNTVWYGSRYNAGLFQAVNGTINSIILTYNHIVNAASTTTSSGEYAQAIFGISTGVHVTHINLLEMYNNEFINLIIYYNDYNLANIYRIIATNNIITHPSSAHLFYDVNFPSACSNYSFSYTMNNINTYVDNDMSGYSDSSATYTYDSCNILTGAHPTFIESLSGRKPNDVYFNVPWLFSSADYNNKNLVLLDVLTLDGSKIVSLESSMFTTLDLSYLNTNNAITLTTTRALRMGNNNRITGNNRTYSIITTSGTINVVNTGYYTNEWHLIEFDNNLHIDKIKFNLNSVSDYGVVRKRSSLTDGIGFRFTNNYVDYNFVPTSPERPAFLFGSNSYINNNTFLLGSSKNISLFGGGNSGGVGGGHVITNNIFTGGGYIFSYLADSIGGVNYKSKFIHNEFAQDGTLYARPFHPTDESKNLIENPSLNGSMFYTTPCTNYQFNIGNWYEDWADSAFYNDSDSDGIHNSYLGVNYIYRGDDYLSNPINDYKSVTPYPFVFGSHLANAVAFYDTCSSFAFNIVSPTDGYNYNSGSDVTTNWEFVSVAYPEMYCFEVINDETIIYENVSSGDNHGMTYEVTDGFGALQVTCCDTLYCDNIVHESDITNFCVGSCDTPLQITDITEPEIEGCTDSDANNYDSTATVDDGSCTYDEEEEEEEDGVIGFDVFGESDFFSTDYENSVNSISSLFGISELPIQITIYVGLTLLAFSILALMFTIIGWLIR